MAFTPQVPRSAIVDQLLLQSSRPRQVPRSAIEGLGQGVNSIVSALIAKKLGKKAEAEFLADNLATIDAFTALAGTPEESAAKLKLLAKAQSQVNLGGQPTPEFSLGGGQTPNSGITAALGGGQVGQLSPQNAALAAQLDPQSGQPILGEQFNTGRGLQASANIKTAVAANPAARARTAVEAAAKRSPAVGARFANALLPDLLKKPETSTLISGKDAEDLGFAKGTVVNRDDSTGVIKVVQNPQQTGSKPKPPSGFRVSEDGSSLVPIEGGPGDISTQNLALAVSRGVASIVADLFGGIYDPQTGRISGIDKDDRARALKVQVDAVKLLQDGEAGSLQEAVQIVNEPEFGLSDDHKGFLVQARQAVKDGKNPVDVRKKLKDLGIDPLLLDQ